MDLSGYEQILAANHRLSASLRTTTPVYSLAQWLEKSFIAQASGQKLLNTHQQLLLIKQLISETHPELLGLAPLIQSAWKTCHQYLFDLNSSLFNKNDDTQFFQIIAHKLNQFYKKYNFTDLDCFMQHTNIPPKTAIIGFDYFTPLEQTILGQCFVINPKKTTQTIYKTSCTDPDQELKTMVLWACSQPEDLQIACIVPDLDTHSNKLSYYFEYILKNTTQFNISAVKKLIDYYFIQDLLTTIPPIEKTQKPSDWANYFENLLTNLYNSAILDTTELQLLTKFREILKAYKNHDYIIKNFNFADALQELKNICSRVVFQPTASKTANIFILSLLESKGLVFDKLWVSGMDTRNFPHKTPYNPFLPFDHVITQAYDFKDQATEIIYSYPETIRDEKIIEYQLLHNISPVNFDLTWPLPVINKKTIKNIPETIPVDINTLKHHGSAIFKDHIACPFRAFAKHRLNAKKPDLLQLGFNALQRGNIIHEILDNLWKALENKNNLINYPEDKLNDLITSLINTSLNKYHKNTQPIFIFAEKTRLAKLVWDWLELEKSREDFIVIATEKTIETHLGKLPLKLRVDRIDQLINKSGENKYLIIDYKTSQTEITGDLLDEPQLPLYAVISAVNIDNIAYGYLRSGNIKLKEIPINNLKSHWEAELHKVAEDFLRGNIEVKPKYGEETCRMCDLQSLCRIKSHHFLDLGGKESSVP